MTPYAEITEIITAAKQTTEVWYDNSRERALVLTKLDEALLWLGELERRSQ